MTSPGHVIYGIVKGAVHNPGVKFNFFGFPEIRKLRSPGYVIGVVMDAICSRVQKAGRDGNRGCADVKWSSKLWCS